MNSFTQIQYLNRTWNCQNKIQMMHLMIILPLGFIPIDDDTRNLFRQPKTTTNDTNSNSSGRCVSCLVNVFDNDYVIGVNQYQSSIDSDTSNWLLTRNGAFPALTSSAVEVQKPTVHFWLPVDWTRLIESRNSIIISQSHTDVVFFFSFSRDTFSLLH